MTASERIPVPVAARTIEPKATPNLSRVGLSNEGDETHE
jgi:hypothetical protein